VQSAYLTHKDALLVAVIEVLRDRLGESAFVVVDHWPDCSEAIGVAAPANPGLLAYISASSGADQPYFVSLEYPPAGEWADHPYTPGEDRDVCELNELIDIVSKHLRSTPPNNWLERSRAR
jgi:hypothetical protein